MSQASAPTNQIRHLSELETEHKTPPWLCAALRHKLGLRGEIGEPVRSHQLGDEWHMTAEQYRKQIEGLRGHSIREGKIMPLAAPQPAHEPAVKQDEEAHGEEP